MSAIDDPAAATAMNTASCPLSRNSGAAVAALLRRPPQTTPWHYVDAAVVLLQELGESSCSLTASLSLQGACAAAAQFFGGPSNPVGCWQNARGASTEANCVAGLTFPVHPTNQAAFVLAGGVAALLAALRNFQEDADAVAAIACAMYWFGFDSGFNISMKMIHASVADAVPLFVGALETHVANAQAVQCVAAALSVLALDEGSRSKIAEAVPLLVKAMSLHRDSAPVVAMIASALDTAASVAFRESWRAFISPAKVKAIEEAILRNDPAMMAAMDEVEKGRVCLSITKALIARAGAIPLLFRALEKHCGDATVFSAVSSVLATLSTFGEVKAEIYRDGSMRWVDALGRHQDSKDVIEKVSKVFDLICDHNNASELARTGATVLLVNSLRRYIASAKLVSAIASVLCKFVIYGARNSSILVDFSQLSVLPLLIFALGKHVENRSTVSDVSCLLQCFAIIGGDINSISHVAGAIPTLIHAMTTHKTRSGIVSSLADVLFYITERFDNKAVVATPPTSTLLVDLLCWHLGIACVVKKISFLLIRLATEEEVKADMVRAGVLVPLIAALGRHRHDTILFATISSALTAVKLSPVCVTASILRGNSFCRRQPAILAWAAARIFS